MWPFKKRTNEYKVPNLISEKFKSIENKLFILSEELAKHLDNHETQKNIHKNCVSQDKVNGIISQFKRK